MRFSRNAGAWRTRFGFRDSAWIAHQKRGRPTLASPARRTPRLIYWLSATRP